MCMCVCEREGGFDWQVELSLVALTTILAESRPQQALLPLLLLSDDEAMGSLFSGIFYRLTLYSLALKFLLHQL